MTTDREGTPPIAAPALGPGDDDPRSPAGVAAALTAAPGPGDLVGPAHEYDYVNAPAAGPGSGDRLTIPIRRRKDTKS